MTAASVSPQYSFLRSQTHAQLTQPDHDQLTQAHDKETISRFIPNYFCLFLFLFCFSLTQTTQASASGTTADYDYGADYFDPEQRSELSYKVQDFLQSVEPSARKDFGHQIKDMLVTCQYRDTPCSVE